jgi:hypothetical protein
MYGTTQSDEVVDGNMSHQQAYIDEANRDMFSTTLHAILLNNWLLLATRMMLRRNR